MRNRSELNSIRETYQNMHDDEILSFAKEEYSKLSGDAFLILREELIKRGIGADVLQAIEHEIILNASVDKNKAIERLNENLFENALEFAFSEKSKGKTQYEIYAGLIEMGVEEHTSNLIINRLDEWTDKLKKDSSIEMQAGLGMVILGIILLFITIEVGHFEAAAILLIVAGIVRIVAYAFKKNKYQKILLNIRQENNDAEL